MPGALSFQSHCGDVFWLEAERPLTYSTQQVLGMLGCLETAAVHARTLHLRHSDYIIFNILCENLRCEINPQTTFGHEHHIRFKTVHVTESERKNPH